jgi:hypothetical protein
MLSLFLILLVLNNNCVNSAETCFEDGSCVDLATFEADQSVLSDAFFNQTCQSFKSWSRAGLCESYRIVAQRVQQTSRTDVAAVLLYSLGGTFFDWQQTLRDKKGRNVPQMLKNPLLLIGNW